MTSSPVTVGCIVLGYLLVAAIMHGVGEGFDAEKHFGDGDDDWPPPWEVVVAFWPLSLVYYSVKWFFKYVLGGTLLGILAILDYVSRGTRFLVKRSFNRNRLPKAEVVKKEAA